MDYSHASYFPGAQPFQQYINVPPLTPSHSNSVASEDFNATSSPEVYEQLIPNGLPHEQFQGYNHYANFNNPAQPRFPHPPTPPNQHHSIARNQPPPQSQQRQPHPLHPRTSSVPAVVPLSDIEVNTERAGSEEPQAPQQGSTEEDDLTPAQSRRKAQNRAAQRAFRERKEKHLKDLEGKLQELEAAQQQSTSENERLKRDLQKVSTENEILRATSNLSGGSGASPGAREAPLMTGPMSYNPTEFYSNVLQNHPNKTPSHRIVTDKNGDRLLAAGATWDYITSHELVRRGCVDLEGISNRLKHQATCDGQGPVFPESAIIAAIEESAASYSDEL